MIRPWAYLDPQDRETFRTVIAFLNKRLAEQGTINWALKLKPGQRIERIAIEDLLANLGPRDLAEPWASAWRLIEESWSAPQSEARDGTAIYGIQKRLRAGDRSGAVVAVIVDLVAPRLTVKPIDGWRWTHVKKPRVPKTFEHLLSASLTSGDLIDLNVLELANLTDISFLTSLATALEAAVVHGLDIARRLGWDGQRRLWQLGDLRRVYYVVPAPRARENKDSDPDTYHHGIAPSVKLLQAVVARIAGLELDSAQPFVRRWRLDGSPVHLRLWAAMSRNNQLTLAGQVADFLLAIDDEKFWDLHVFPEIAELRADRFRDLDQEAQKVITARILKGPPRNHWPRKEEAAKVNDARLYWSVRELKRIEVAGGILPERSKSWLDARLAQFADLANMTIDEGFPEGAKFRWVPPNPDDRYNTLEGVARLRALETALSTSRGGWDDDPADRANDWIKQQGNAEKVLADFETTNNGGDDFPEVWNRFGWAHRPRQQDGQATQDANIGAEAGSVLGLLNQLSNTTLSSAIEGICAWLDAWEKQAVKLPLALPIWLRLWPIAVEATNRKPEEADEADLSVVARVADDDREPMDLDTLNTPAGKLVGVFLAACPSLPPGARAFSADSMERRMRDAVIAARGRSGLIARHRLIESLHYFLQADGAWTEHHLVRPLNDDGAESDALWRAVARGLSRPPRNIVEILGLIGSRMTEKANDRGLGRNTRRGLVFRLVAESLHAFREGRDPAVPNSRIQQMLRILDDEVRASAANAIQQFVRELSKRPAVAGTPDGGEQEDATSAAALFRTAAAPFLRDVWPQERSLATPGVSGAFADLPAISGEAFVEAVEAIARFLVPFECWSMVNYGLYGEEGGAKKLTAINDEQKARALLKLLDLTVGTSEGAVIPHDLTDALDQIRSAAPALVNSPVFRRLSTAARR